MDTREEHAAVLFSGGRDSSLAACLLAQKGVLVHLITLFNGAAVKGDISDYRYEELRSAFPCNIVARVTLPSYSLFRRVALADIEGDFAKYKKNLILVGDAVASHTEVIIYCLRNGISTMASGFTKHESHYPEQLPKVVELFREFVSEYGISYLTPVFDYESVNQVKYRLFDFGISTKSLEGTSLFSNTYSQPTLDVVLKYTKDKLLICREYIRFKLTQNRALNIDPSQEEPI